MIRPSPNEVTEYAKSIGFSLKGEHFCDYYESKGWCVGKSPMKSWQAAVRTWKHNSPPSSLVGNRYDPNKMASRELELELIREREWQKRHEKPA